MPRRGDAFIECEGRICMRQAARVRRWMRQDSRVHQLRGNQGERLPILLRHRRFGRTDTRTIRSDPWEPVATRVGSPACSTKSCPASKIQPFAASRLLEYWSPTALPNRCSNPSKPLRLSVRRYLGVSEPTSRPPKPRVVPTSFEPADVLVETSWPRRCRGFCSLTEACGPHFMGTMRPSPVTTEIVAVTALIS